MAQHDYDVANGTGGAVRADLNAALDAIVTNNSGATAPSVTFPFMFWYDTANSLMKQRNAANTAWVVIDTSAYLPLTGGTLTGALTAPALNLTGNFSNTSNAPAYAYTDTGSTTNNKRWQDFITANVRHFQVTNDANSVANDWMIVSRVLQVVSVNFPQALSVSGLLSALGGQIAFPATQIPSANVNTLDDYEEGTFTPVFIATGCTFSYALQEGTYIKIGQLVYFRIRLILNTTGNTLAANTLTMGGLPFTSAAVTTSFGAFPINWNVTTASYVNMQASVIASNTTLSVVGIIAAGVSFGSSTILATNALSATGGTTYVLSGVYQASA